LALKRKDHEKLTDVNILKVISLLARPDTPITKKEACEILNIRYNTTRLQKIIDEFEEIRSYKTMRKNQNKGKGATRAEIKEVLELYLGGDNISVIAKQMYRSNAFIKAIIDRVGMPEKLPQGFSRNQDILLPEQCIAESFEVGERVWAARENAPAKVLREHTLAYQESMPGLHVFDYEEKYGAKGYQLYIYENAPMTDEIYYVYGAGQPGHYSFALAYDIGSLKHLEQYGVSF
jgi:hypothetical protein